MGIPGSRVPEHGTRRSGQAAMDLRFSEDAVRDGLTEVGVVARFSSGWRGLSVIWMVRRLPLGLTYIV